MPNWCENQVTISGAMKELKRFLTDCGYFDGHQFSFQRLLPMPEELEGISQYTENGKECYRRKETLLDESEVALLRDKYGAVYWYDWNIQNWGTKWDIGSNDANWDCDSDYFSSSHSNISDDEYADIAVHFDTAWGPPEELYRYLISKYALDFDWFYKEPGMRFAGWLGS